MRNLRNFTSIPFFALLNGNVGNTGRYMDAVQTTFSGLINPKTKKPYTKDEFRPVYGEGQLYRKPKSPSDIALDKSKSTLVKAILIA